MNSLMSPQLQFGAPRSWKADSMVPPGIGAPLDAHENTRFNESTSLGMTDAQQIEFGGCPEHFVGIQAKMR